MTAQDEPLLDDVAGKACSRSPEGDLRRPSDKHLRSLPEPSSLESESMPFANIGELFAQTLQGGFDDDEAWEAVQSLRRIGTQQVFDEAAKWTDSTEPLMRARGLDVIAQLGKTAARPSNSFPQASYDIVVKAVQREREVQPLNSAISALGHLDDPRAIPLIAALHSHPSEQIRFTVACRTGLLSQRPAMRPDPPHTYGRC